MARTKGSKNKAKPVTEGGFELTLEQRMRMIADLIVEQIREDREYGHNLVEVLSKDASYVAERK